MVSLRGDITTLTDVWIEDDFCVDGNVRSLHATSAAPATLTFTVRAKVGPGGLCTTISQGYRGLSFSDTTLTQ